MGDNRRAAWTVAEGRHGVHPAHAMPLLLTTGSSQLRSRTDARPVPPHPRSGLRAWALAIGLWLLLALAACGGAEEGGSPSATAALSQPANADLAVGPASDVSVAPTAVALASLPAWVQAAALPRFGADQLVLLVAEGDPLSEAVAQRYQQARGLSDRQVLRVKLPADVGDAIDATAFQALRAELMARLDDRAQAMLVTWSRPSRVQGPCAMSITAALSFGFDAARCGGCSKTTASPYYDSPAIQPWTQLQLRPAMMLGATTLAEADALIARGLASEGLMTRGGVQAQGWLVRTSDPARSVRYPDFGYAAALSVPGLTWHRVDNAAGASSNVVTGQADLLFYFTGLTHVPGAETNRWLPGAYADHMTSYAGVLPSGGGQMPATAWLAAGATGSYGSVEEPCNYVEKFPQASVLVRHYATGQTLIEALWKSVRWPGQGLFLGDPLARPWASR